jgi:hypothetical protein
MRQRREDFLIFGAREIGEAEIANVIEELCPDWLGSGPWVGGLR